MREIKAGVTNMRVHGRKVQLCIPIGCQVASVEGAVVIRFSTEHHRDVFYAMEPEAARMLARDLLESDQEVQCSRRLRENF